MLKKKEENKPTYGPVVWAIVSKVMLGVLLNRRVISNEKTRFGVEVSSISNIPTLMFVRGNNSLNYYCVICTIKTIKRV